LPHNTGPRIRMTAVVLALAAATLLGSALVLTQFGLRYVAPLPGAAISIPSFTLLFICLAPFLLRGETVVWGAVPVFAAVGLFFPSVLTLLTFEGNRLLGPVVTGTLGNLSPLVAVAIAVLVLAEPIRVLQGVGLVVIVMGVVVITVRRSHDMRDWRHWTLLLPLCAAALRGLMQPVVKLGLTLWPNPIAAGLIGYIVSALVVLIYARLRTGRFVAVAPLSGRLWFVAVGMSNGLGVLMMYAALADGPVSLVAPLVATYPLVTVGLGALAFGGGEGAMRLAAGTALTVAGVVLLLVG
jgi:drug/metabolite transporter (DMT)-like permease